MMDVRDIERKLELYATRTEEILVAYLFGSTAQGKSTPLSDIDVAFLIDQRQYEELDRAFSYGYKAQRLSELIDLFHSNKVDLVVLNEAPPLLQHQVLRYGKIVYEKDPEARICFTINATKRYLDTKHLRDIQYRYLLERYPPAGE